MLTNQQRQLIIDAGFGGDPDANFAALLDQLRRVMGPYPGPTAPPWPYPLRVLALTILAHEYASGSCSGNAPECSGEGPQNTSKTGPQNTGHRGQAPVSPTRFVKHPSAKPVFAYRLAA